ncbi:MAG TPA: hypothetical protein VGX68_23100 [Thermoanaerobaculia bacterium]|nr:hypothetical protein [Thermoanaerobaculia bacterium]
MSMSTALSVAEILEKLEKRLASHRQQAAFHAEQEAHHRERSAFHTAEMEKVAQHLEAFKATAVAAAELAKEAEPPPPPVKEEEEDDRETAGQPVRVSKLIAKVVDRMAEGETFGATRIAAETNRRYKDKLPRPVDNRAVSVALRRLRKAGRLRLAREGKAVHEALYTKAARKPAVKPAAP